MFYFDRINERIKKLGIFDLGVMKVCLIAFTLMIAKLCPAVLSLEWGWYAAIFVVSYGYILAFFFFRK